MEYQRDRRDQTEIIERARAVSPAVLGYDVLAASKEASHFAYELESKFVAQRQAYRLKDADIIEALAAVYLAVYRLRPHSSTNRFSAYLVEWVLNTLGPALEEDLSAEEQEMVVLRLILSVKNMTGGANGECAYLNYISDQIGG
jgi:hypothetical protein